MDRKSFFVLVLLAGVGVFVSGCLVAAVGVGAAGTVAYVKGDLEAVEAAKLDNVYKATEKALDALELKVIEKRKDELSGKFIVRDAQDKKITIGLTATAEGTTKLSIRVGLFGSEEKSRLIYEKIKENLKK